MPQKRTYLNLIRRPRGVPLAGIAIATLLVMLQSLSLLAETPHVIAKLDRTQIFVGETVLYRVLLNHCGMQAAPEMSGFEQFDVKLVSRTRFQSKGFMRGRRINQIGPLYLYQLTPRMAGTLTVPGPSVEIDGKTYVGQTLTLKVSDIEDQDLVRLKMSTDPESVYPMQPIRIRLTVAVKGLPAPVSETDPLQLPLQLRRVLPSLTIPWADDEQLDDALEPREPFSRWLGQYMDQKSYGVAINNLQKPRSGIIDLFGSGTGDRRVAFRPTPNIVIRQDGQGRPVEYWEYLFERTVIPQRAGSFSLGTVSIKGQFAARINTRGNVELETVYAIARLPALIVKQPPLAGRPATFTGAIGSFTGGAEISPVEARVGDPMTLTVWLRGVGTLSETAAPDLAANATIARDFKMYEATGETNQDTRRFTYSLRPKKDDITQFPSIPLTYFDVNQEQYVTLQTEPIPLSITAATQLASSEIAMSRHATGRGGEIDRLTGGINANVTDLSQFRNDRVQPNQWFLNMGGLAGLFAAIALVTQRLKRAREDSGLQRRKSALGRARRRIEAAVDQSSREVADEISGALVGLVADICNLAEEGLTSADAASGLASQGVAPALVGQLKQVLETCDAMRYASVGTECDALHEQAQTLFTELAQELRSRKLTS